MVWKERLHPTYILKPRLHHTVSPIDFVIHTENTFYPFSLVSPKKKKNHETHWTPLCLFNLRISPCMFGYLSVIESCMIIRLHLNTSICWNSHFSYDIKVEACLHAPLHLAFFLSSLSFSIEVNLNEFRCWQIYQLEIKHREQTVFSVELTRWWTAAIYMRCWHHM